MTAGDPRMSSFAALIQHGNRHGEVAVTTTATLERLAADGVIGPPAAAQRPAAAGRPRPRARRPLADIVSEQRR
jgi:hypothetical protein